MELSDLSEFNGHLLSPDDKTGMLYEIQDGKAIPWVFLNSGPGNTTKGMKAEWLTIKGDRLYVGGHGCEYRDKNGKVKSEDAMWIKIVTKTGEVTSENWKHIYSRMRNKAGYPKPGYLTHEAVQWSEIQRKWYFLPRKASTTKYNEKEDEMKGANMIIESDADLKSFKFVLLGRSAEQHPGIGFSAFDFVPDTNDELIVAIKSKEVTGSDPESYITVLSVKGRTIMRDQKLEGNLKFEGIYFV
ncbi:Apyrase [Necator americanus]|nr:Apyrase [Necator americanus]ETN72936.1 Apyrase [Necator americanus]